MKKYFNFIKKHIKVVLLYLLAIASIIVTIVYYFFKRQLVHNDRTQLEGTQVIHEIEETLNKAHEEAAISHAVIKAETDVERHEIEEIVKIDDGVERRKRLAEKLSKLK